MEIKKYIEIVKELQREGISEQIICRILEEEGKDRRTTQMYGKEEKTPQKPLKQESKAIDRPTEKQIYFLNKNKIEIPKTKKEASDLIKKCKESY